MKYIMEMKDHKKLPYIRRYDMLKVVEFFIKINAKTEDVKDDYGQCVFGEIIRKNAEEILAKSDCFTNYSIMYNYECISGNQGGGNNYLDYTKTGAVSVNAGVQIRKMTRRY